MGFMARLFGAPAARQPQPAVHPRHDSDCDSDGTRRQLVEMALRDIARTHGLPREWLSVRCTPSAGRSRGMHVRMVIKHWHADLPMYQVALQNSLRLRLQRLDPLSSQWIRGVSWELSLADDTVCPVLPAPTHWRGALSELPKRAAPGPREALDRLFATEDRWRATVSADFTQTQPMVLEPA